MNIDKPTELVHVATAVEHHDVEEIDPADDSIELGQWYWVQRVKPVSFYDDETEDWIETTDAWIGCVVALGSNYATIQGPGEKEYERIHLDKFTDRATLEPDAEGVLLEKTNRARGKVLAIMAEINRSMRELGMRPPNAGVLTSPTVESQALALLGDVDLSGYKTALAELKDTGLPALYKSLKKAHAKLAVWMQAPTIPLHAQVSELKETIEVVDDRLLTLDLYAGLSEQVKQIRKGAPAAFDEKLHVYQRMLYMDEECLPFYSGGGMRFNKLAEFDRWLARKEVRNRVLPDPRCVVAFRIRRNMRTWEGGDGSFASLAAYISFWEEAKLDRYTFLYVRNGDQLYRINTDFDFGHRLFPCIERDDGEPLYAYMNHGEIREITTLETPPKLHPNEDYDADDDELDAWERHRGAHWEPFNVSSVYYDDIVAYRDRDIKHFNRVALILQGLFDRSTILHPHAPVQLWTNEAFDNAIKLVYDLDRAIAPADMPDFELYRAEGNAKIVVGTNTIGQYAVWNKKWQSRRREDREQLKQGDYGPGFVVPVDKIGRDGKLTYLYTRNTSRWSRALGGWHIAKCSFTCEKKDVFNVDTYKPGDFHRFYDDPRTRADYLRWAPFLLGAEDFKAGL
jgi:hypothetical protein